MTQTRGFQLPALAASPDGRLDLLYYDRRADPRNIIKRGFRSSFSFDAGNPDLGSRLGLISDEHRTLGAWTDARAGTPATQKQDLMEAVPL